MNKNTGLLVGNHPQEYLFGSTSPIVHEVRNSTKDWRAFRSRDERQNMNPEDRMYCVTGSGTNVLEQQANWMLVNNLWPADALKFFTDNGYIVDGKFEISRRFTAKMSGTTHAGNYFYKVWDSIRHDGIVPDSKYPDDKSLTWDEFYQPISNDLLLLGKESLKYFNVQYEDFSNSTSAQKLIAREMAPLQFGVPTGCGWQAEVPLCNLSPNHAIDGDHQRPDTSEEIFDSYDPFTKHLAKGYPIPICYRAVLYPIRRDAPVTTVSKTFDKDMIFGETSEDVGRLQEFLKVIEPVTKYYGSMTKDKVKEFMEFKNIGTWWEKNVYPAGRRVGPKIRAAINQLIK